MAEYTDLGVERERRARAEAFTRIERKLQRTPNQTVIGNVSNVTILLELDPALAGLCGWNEFISSPMLLRAPPALDQAQAQAGLTQTWPRIWQREDVTLVQAYIERIWKPGRLGRETVDDAMRAVAKAHPFHPVRDWLASLQWDGKPRLDTWLTKAFGSPENAYHSQVGAKVLIAAVRRVRVPGCKFDHMMILEGPQNIGKSTAGRRLAGPPWFTDNLPSKLESKEASQALRGVWVVEFAEIEQIIRSEVEVIKAFITRQIDRYRTPFGREVAEYPRQCVLIGTTNEQDYLRDATGNRRFWPVVCKFADVDWIAENREQLWAEAAAREASGEVLYLVDEEAAAQAGDEQAERVRLDPWFTVIETFLKNKTHVTVDEVLGYQCLAFSNDQRMPIHVTRVRGVLRMLGWYTTTDRDSKGKKIRVWKPKV